MVYILCSSVILSYVFHGFQSVCRYFCQMCFMVSEVCICVLSYVVDGFYCVHQYFCHMFYGSHCVHLYFCHMYLMVSRVCVSTFVKCVSWFPKFVYVYCHMW